MENSSKLQWRTCFRTLLSLFTAILLAATSAFSDGKMFVWRNKDVDIFQPTQKAVIYWDGSEEKLILQTKYEGPAEEMVWVVPVPSEPEVSKGDPQIFEEMSKRTQEPDIAYTTFAGDASRGGSASPLKWQKRIGAYDVALLSPVGSQQVIQWLESNEYGVPDSAVPILEDYVQRQWWMVASRVHKDALVAATREKLAKGTLHPLEMTFRTSTCVYPLRLTSLAAGPVEELIYIEAPEHYVPKTLAGPGWDIDFYGGPRRWLPRGYRSFRRAEMWDAAKLIADGKDKVESSRCISKLRRTFQPQEMTDDIEFGKADYAPFASSGDPAKIAQAATQYGRHRDPAGVPLLQRVVAANELKNEPHIRSSIWALGEIAVGKADNSTIESTLVHCTGQADIEVKMEAYMALAKFNSKRIEELLIQELAKVRDVPVEQWGRADSRRRTFSGEAAAWLDEHASGTAREEYIQIVLDLLEKTLARIEIFRTADTPTVLGGFTTKSIGNRLRGSQLSAIRRAATLGEPRFLKPLRAIRKTFEIDMAEAVEAAKSEFERPIARILIAEAACGSDDALAELVKLVVSKEAKLLEDGYGEHGYASRGSLNRYSHRESLRTRILRSQDRDFPGFDDSNPEGTRPGRGNVPLDVQDRVFRRAARTKGLNEWYALYLLSWITTPTADDKDRLRSIWRPATGTPDEVTGKRLIVADVLYSWGDEESLVLLLPKCKDNSVRLEMVWALAKLGSPEAAPFIEQELRERWNSLFVERNAFPRSYRLGNPEYAKGVVTELGEPHIVKAFWEYLFLPANSEDEHIESEMLKGLCSDRSLHPGLRYALLTEQAWRSLWKRPLIEELFEKSAAVSIPKDAYRGLAFALGQVHSTELLLSLFEEADTPWKKSAIIGGLDWTRDERILPCYEKMLREILYEEYRESGEVASWPSLSIFFSSGETPYRQPHKEEGLALFASLLTDESYDASYRALVAVHMARIFRTALHPQMKALQELELTETARKALEMTIEITESH